MRIFVTGAAGYIGSHTVRHLQNAGHEVFAYDNLSRGHRAAMERLGLDERFFEGDLLESAKLDHALVMTRPEAVLHFAAFALVGESVTRPDLYWKNNVLGSISLLDAMRRNSVGKLVFSSTCATYGVPEKMPMDESLPQSPINPYGQSKLTMEKAISDYTAAFGWQCASLRYFNAAGASSKGDIGEDHEPESHLIPLAFRAIQKIAPPLTVFGTDYPTPDGTCIRDYIHVDDLAQAHLAALLHLKKQPQGTHEAFNLGTGQGNSVREVMAACERASGRPVPHKTGPRRPGDPPSLVADPAKAARILGWKAVHDLESITQSAWKWHQSHPRGYSTPKV
jgi:UDP-glucose 4-epimerase